MEVQQQEGRKLIFFFFIMVSISFCLRSLPLWAVLLFVCVFVCVFVCLFSVAVQFIRVSLVAQLVKNLPSMQETPV